MNLPVVDLFSCGGGMSTGFSGAFGFKLTAAVDLEVAKPSGKSSGDTGCNRIYEANHGLVPILQDIINFSPHDLMRIAGLQPGDTATLISCSPCTDFSRANPLNHLQDKSRNSLVVRSGDFVDVLRPQTFAMENVRELLTGNHPHHWSGLRECLIRSGMNVQQDIHVLTRFGLPQKRERALVMAVRGDRVRTLPELWDGWELRPETVTVRHAFDRLREWQTSNPSDVDGAVYPGNRADVFARIMATPADGGGWLDVARSGRLDLLTNDCLRRFREGDCGSHPDGNGRMWWDRPASTLKRECAHTGNGRYLHPSENRLMTVREAATLQGFPFDYMFPIRCVANRYRAIGDAVPPIIARQIAACLSWSMTGRKPSPEEWVMPRTTLRVSDLQRVSGKPVAMSAVRGPGTQT